MPIANPTLWFCWLCGGELMLCVLCAVHIVDHGSLHNGRRWLIASRRCQDHWARVSSPACSGSNTFSNLSSIFGGSDDFLLASVGLARTMNHLPSVFIIPEDALPGSWGTSPSVSPLHCCSIWADRSLTYLGSIWAIQHHDACFFSLARPFGPTK